MVTPDEKPKADERTTGQGNLLIQWVWRIIWSLTFLLPASRRRDSLTRWAWGIACAVLGACLLWYAIQCLVEARTNSTGGYVPVYEGQGYERDWVDDRWAEPAQYRRSKYAEAFGTMIFVGICAFLAHKLLALDDSLPMTKSYFIQPGAEPGRRGSVLGCALRIHEQPYVDAGWRRITHKIGRVLAKQPPGHYFYTVGGPDRFCRQRDYVTFVHNQKWQSEIMVTAEKRRVT
jgi:hypothetical protein